MVAKNWDLEVNNLFSRGFKYKNTHRLEFIFVGNIPTSYMNDWRRKINKPLITWIGYALPSLHH